MNASQPSSEGSLPANAGSQSLPLVGSGDGGGEPAAASAPAPSSAFGPHRTPYDAIGGEMVVRALIDAFYDEMHANPAYAGIRALHQPDLASARDKLFAFLSGWLGGPQLFIQQHGHPRLRMRHAPFPIGEHERDQWLACMAHALDQCEVKGELRTFLDQRFAHVADFMRNR